MLPASWCREKKFNRRIDADSTSHIEAIFGQHSTRRQVLEYIPSFKNRNKNIYDFFGPVA